MSAIVSGEDDSKDHDEIVYKGNIVFTGERSLKCFKFQGSWFKVQGIKRNRGLKIV